MFTVALTGGIASGKTTVSDHFQKLGVPVIDTDLISRDTVAPGQPALALIAETFGKDVLSETGQLNRQQLRDMIFSDANKRQQLEAIMHPAIYAEVDKRLQQLNADYAIVVIPLLIETGADFQADRVLVVDVPESVQLSRVMQRDNIGETQAQQILDAQAPRDARLARADDILLNTGLPKQLCEDVEVLHRKYLHLAQGR